MEFYEVIEKRRSIRQFEDREIPKETLERILTAGLKAPSSNHQRRWELVTLTDKALIRELAQSLGVFRKIGFLDDDLKNPLAMGRCDDCLRYLEEYPIAIPSVGDQKLRMQWLAMLARSGFVLPILVHPTATVSPSAAVGYGTVIEARATVSPGVRIGNGCIIASGATIDRNVKIPDGTLVGCGRVITAADFE